MNTKMINSEEARTEASKFLANLTPHGLLSVLGFNEADLWDAGADSHKVWGIQLTLDGKTTIHIRAWERLNQIWKLYEFRLKDTGEWIRIKGGGDPP